MQYLGPYHIVEPLGQGGMARVYKAYQHDLGRYVALKTLLPELSANPQFVNRFQHEAQTVRRLRHPHIVDVYDVGHLEGMYYIAMEYVPGPALEKVLVTSPKLAQAQVARIVSQIASALDYARRQQVVHRDVKPGNILFAGDEHVKLSDFGIAKALDATSLTRTGTMMGTPAYMSPEQVRGQKADYASDVYALGVVAYEMLTGCRPFRGDMLAVLHAQVYEVPDLSLLPVRVKSVLGRALDKHPQRRYASAGAFAQALAHGLADSVTPVRHSAKAPRSRGARGRPGIGAPEGATLFPAFFVLLAAVLISTWLALGLPRQKESLPTRTAEVRLVHTVPPTTGDSTAALSIQLRQPQDNAEIVLVEDQPIKFAWHYPEGLNGRAFELVIDGDGSNDVVKRPVASSYYLGESLAPGDYIWTVRMIVCATGTMLEGENGQWVCDHGHWQVVGDSRSRRHFSVLAPTPTPTPTPRPPTPTAAPADQPSRQTSPTDALVPRREPQGPDSPPMAPPSPTPVRDECPAGRPPDGRP